MKVDRRLAPLLLALLAAPAFAVEIDGKVSPGEWDAARHIDGFRKIIPLNGEPSSLPTEAWILSTPEGLAVAVHCTQPVSIPRTLQKMQRDFEDQVDRVNVMIDFDGDHRTGYVFRLSSTGGIYDGTITNENNFNGDWDGNWRHATTMDDEGWTAEVLIPWHIAAMREAADQRTIGVFIDRVTVASGERVAWPWASFERPRFLSDFAPVEVKNYSQSLLAITPYVSGLHDNVGKHDQGSAGVDVFWKPNGQTQLTATVNPDFGQVESDDLVVNFDATETFFSDKRPFFTENQGIFELTTPSDYSQLLYTRRIGGPADDGRGLGDILAAVKLNGSVGATKYGLFAADERESVGRDFEAVRLVRDFASQNLGFMATHVDRPYLDREATTAGIDHNWRPSARWSVQTRWIASAIDDSGTSTHGDGATLWAAYEMDHGWRQQVILMHFGNDLDIDDAGYLQRADQNYSQYQLNKRFTDLPESSRYASKDWRWRVTEDRNDRGQELYSQFRMSRESRLRNGSYEYGQVNVNSAGIDDLILRGNGYVNVPANFNSYFDYQRPRIGNWSYEAELNVDSGGLSGNRKIGYTLDIEPRYYVSDAFNVSVDFRGGRNPDWVLWKGDNLLGSYDQRFFDFRVGFNWTITSRHELRLKLQAIGLNAKAWQAYRVDAAGRALETDDAIDDLSVRNLGVQLRYRYEVAPLSYLYVVYGRGGYRQDDSRDGAGGLLGDSFSLRDDEQLLVKFSYRFEH